MEQHTAWCLRRVRRTTLLLLEEETRADTVRYLARHSYWLVVPTARRALRMGLVPGVRRGR